MSKTHAKNVPIREVLLEPQVEIEENVEVEVKGNLEIEKDARDCRTSHFAP